MSPIILTVGANIPTHLKFMNGNITEVTPEKLQMSPYFSVVWVICPHFSKALAEHCVMRVKSILIWLKEFQFGENKLANFG